MTDLCYSDKCVDMHSNAFRIKCQFLRYDQVMIEIGKGTESPLFISRNILISFI